MSQTYHCKNCAREFGNRSFYSHSRICYELVLAECSTCNYKKVYAEAELQRHSNLGHTIVHKLSIQEQKRKLKLMENPMKRKRPNLVEENKNVEEESNHTIIVNDEEVKIQELYEKHKVQTEQNKLNQTIIEELKSELEEQNKLIAQIRTDHSVTVTELQCRLQEKNERADMLKAALERTKMERDEMELYATSNRNIMQETLKKLYNAEAQLKSANLDYRFVRIDFLVKSNLSCIYLAKIETKTETKRVIIKQFLSDSDRKEELAIQTSLNSLPCVRQYLPHFEFLSMPGSMVFAYYNGTLSNIREVLNDSDKFIKTIVKQAFEALHKIHDRRVLHLDVKPNNFLFVWDDKNDTLQVVIGDFGLSKQLPENTSTRQTATIKTTRAGTSYYRAPEIYKLVACKASDIYSMAVALLVIFSKNQDTLKHLDKQLQQTKSKVTKSSNTSEQTSSTKSIIERPAKSAQVVLSQIPPEMIVPAWSAFFQHLKPMLNNMLAENINHRPNIPEIIQHIDLFETKQ